MKKYIAFFLFSLIACSVYAQRTCNHESHMETLMQDPSYANEHRQRQSNFNIVMSADDGTRAQCANPVTLPMAVHFQGISSPDQACLVALAQSQIDILNQDYGGYNSDISNWVNNASQYYSVTNGEACIAFCLATQNHPTGYGLTNGDPAVTINQTSGDSDSNWAGYINIWVRAGTGVLGYSPLGGSGNGDGVVIDANAFGSGSGCGSISPNAPYNLGRTLTHELGHYLNLNHIWGPGNGSCTQDDGIADTPNSQQAYYGCQTVGSTSSCSSNDLHMNYMDYADDACMYMFTPGQATVMENYVAANLSNVINNFSNVCSAVAVNSNDAGISAHITPAPNSSNCSATSITPEVTLTNFGTGTLTSVTISYSVNGGTPVSQNWTGSLAQNATTNVTLTAFTPPNGTWTFESYTSNPNGATDEDTSNDATNTTHQIVSPISLPYAEDFEGSTTFPTTNGINIINPDGDAFVWAVTNTVSANGTGNSSVLFDNYNGDGSSNPGGTIDALVTPVFDFSSVSDAELTFDVAYAPYDTNNFDSLIVLVSTDCGTNYNQVVFIDGNTGLATGSATTNAYTPANNEWNNISVDLSAYDGSANISIAIANLSGWGNNMYIDNINVQQATSCGVTASATATTCIGNDGTATATPDMGVNVSSYAWSNGGSTASITGLAPGTYTVTLTDTGGCTSTSTATVADGCSVGCDTISNFDFANHTPNVYGASGGTGYLSGNNSYGDLAKADYFNYTGSNTSIQGGLIYFEFLSITNPATSSLDVAVWDGTGGTPGALLGSQTVLLQDIQDQLDGGSIYLAEFSTPITLPASNEFFFGAILPTAAGDTAVIITNTVGDATTNTAWELFSDGSTWSDYNSSWGVDFAHYIAPILGTEPTADFDTFGLNFCPNQVIPIGNNSTNATSYEWSFPGGSPSTSTDVNPSVVYPAPGSYDITLKALNDCLEDEITYTIIIDQPFVNIDGTDALCNGSCDGTATINPIGGNAPFTYIWSNGDTGANINGLCAGTYTATIIDGNGCEVVENYTVNEPTSVISATTSATSTTCAGNDGSISVSATGGTGNYTYLWSDGQTDDFNNGLDVGTYTVTVTDANGCTGTATAIVTDGCGCGAFSSSVTIVDATCNGACDGSATVTQSGGTAPITYTWSNGQNTATAFGLCLGTYDVTVEDSNGCQDVQSVTIIEPAAIVATTTSNPTTCTGNDGSATVSATGGTAPYTYLWSDGQTDDFNPGLDVGTYTVTVTDANGCMEVATAVVSDGCGCTLTVSTSGSDTPCNGECNGTVTANPANGTAPYTYVWSDGQTGMTATGLCVGIASVTVTDINGCTATGNYTISEPSLMIPTTTNTETTCIGNDGTATVSVTGGIPPYSYSWSNGETNETATGLSIGSHTVTITDLNGCTATSTVLISDGCGCGNFSADISSIVDVSCNGGNDGSAAVSATGGTAPYTYLWSDGQTDDFNPGLTVGTYTVTVTDANGCNETISLTINEPSSIVVSLISQSDESCFGNDGTAVVSATGGTGTLSYLWSNGEIGANANALSNGIATVTITDVNGCSEVFDVVIGNSCACSLVVVGSSTDISCNSACDGTATANNAGGNGAISYNWSNGATTQTATGLCAGTYTVTVTDGNGCAETASVTIVEPSIITITINSNNANCGANTGSASASATGGTSPLSYAWSNGATTSTITNINGGNYSVTVTDANGCSATDNVTVTQGTSVSATGTVTQPSCNGGTDGEIILTTTGSGIPFSYNWSNGATTENLTGIGAGSYSVTITDINGCDFTSTFNVNEPSSININLNITNATSANNGSIVASTSGGTAPYSWAWSNGATGILNSGLAPGTYTVTVTDADGCAETATGTVDDLTSTYDTALITDWNVYPNPNNGAFTLNLELTSQEDITVRIHNVLGQTVLQNQYSTNSLTESYELNNITQGTYILEMIIGDSRVIEKLTIVK